ncbi:PAS domain S-box protein [Spirosoma endophyticum]|uniref:histidine kinase n=1 Tax=Spirosoma endophyticum TaxID=662367 RepID=A0A1I2ESV3_9BACT|nr:PAS domain S-box protein [Spirosoma endophyticum]SFE96194.1 PAS domain S-box-containing protein [Spirosoma endophyticum]
MVQPQPQSDSLLVVYHTAFENSIQGFCLLEKVATSPTDLSDFRYLLTNAAFEQQAGLHQAVGKTLRQLVPGVEARIMEYYDQVALTGQPIHFEDYVTALDWWMAVDAFPVGEFTPLRIGVLFANVTERKRHEQQQDYLLTLGDVLRSLADPVAIKERVTQLAMQYFGVDRCWYCTIQAGKVVIRHDAFRGDFASVAGVYPLSSFALVKKVIDEGRPLIVHDMTTTDLLDETLRALCLQEQVTAMVAVPLKHENSAGILCLVQSTPRHWRAVETQLMVETAERTWGTLERARAEEALRDSETRLRTLVQNLPDYAIFRLDAAGIITEWTEGAQRVKGYTAEEAIGQHLSLFYTPQAIAAGEVDAELAQAARTGRTEREGPRLPKNGDRIFVNEIATAIYDGQGELTGFTKISRDITTRKAEQEQLRHLEERTRIAVEAAQMGTWEWNLLTNEVYWNEQHFELFGLQPQLQPQSPDTFSQHLHPDDRGWVMDELNRAVWEKTLYEAEFRIVREDTGQTAWMSGYGRITDEVDGRASRMSGVMVEVTERRLAEDKIRDSQQRLQLILDSIADHAILTFDPDTTLTSWNTGAEQLFNYPAGEAIGQSVQIIFTPEDRATGELEKKMERARREGQTPDERDHLRKDGSRLYIWGVLSPLHNADGQLLGYVKVARDLSERRSMEQALRETDRRKDEFLAMLAHELRNPMSTIRSGLQILTLTVGQEHTTGPSGGNATIAMMTRQTDQLVRLVDDLLDVSRISQGKIELHKQRIELAELVSQAAESVRTFYWEQGRHLQVDLPTVPIYVVGDATRLTQVVTNLLTNGARYTGEGGQVWVSLTYQHQEALLEVRDNGIGLAPDQLMAIFELFVQVDNSTARSKGGLGLGLTLVKRLVELHGGWVVAQSKGVGKGSAFYVHLPTIETVPAVMLMPVERATTLTPSQRLLVIDDNVDAGLTLSLLLKLKGYEAHTRTSGRAGIDAAEALQPGAILLDIGMPDMDSYETCRLIRQQPWGKAMVVIALSGYGQEEDRQQTQATGFDGHLVKPVDLDALTGLLRSLQSKDPSNSRTD